MTNDPDRAVAAAILDHLRLQSGVTALLGPRVYPAPSREPVYPYLALSRSEARPASGDVDTGLEHILTLTAVSRFGGPEEARAIVAAVRAALEGARPLAAGHSLTRLHVSYSDVFRGSDWRYHLGILRLRCVSEAA